MSNRGRYWYKNKGKRKRSSDDKPGDCEGGSGPSKKRPTSTPPSNKNTRVPSRSQKNSVYDNWEFYFHDEEFRKGSSTEKKILAMEKFINCHQDLFPVANLENEKPYVVDVKILYKDDAFTNEWNTFKEDLFNNPKHTLNAISVAIDQTIVNAIKQREGMDDPSVLASLPKAVARLSNYGPVIPLRDLKVNSYGKLLSIRGCIMRVGSVKHSAQWIEFSCMSCAYCKVVRQIDGIYTLPSKCVACNTKKFQPILSSRHTKTVTFQVTRLQEHFGDEQDDKGRRPCTIDVDLIEDLVSTCMPGDDVTVTGIIKVRGNEARSSNTKGDIDSSVFSLYMEAIHILNNKYKSQNKCTVGFDLTEADYNAIREIYHDPNPFKLLVHSLCPSIYGHDLIKAGLLLSLFGGNTNTNDIRDDIHILVFGDPGLGKSQLLKACARVAPKGVFVCGSSSTSTGLTATLVKDNSDGEYVLEPGALVMADKGCCCIDEFDKMSTQHQALLEAMEQQSVSLAKSGMVCCLPARTSILAAANPAGGRYNRSKTIIENLNMSLPLLSRFDLIFIVLDQPNEHLDDLLSEHVIAAHAPTSSSTGKSKFRSSNPESRATRSQSTLRQKLSLLPTDRIDPVPHRILRNYILYAKQYVKPTITPAAVEVLQKFYLKCRAKNDCGKITPMTARQLGALVRLTEARAKLELREEATDIDASEVAQIIEFSMADVAVKPVILDNSIFSRSGKLTANKVKAFVSLLTNRANAEGNNLFTTTEMKDMAKRDNLVIDDFNSLISKLNENGVILKKAPHLYSLISNN